MDRRLAPIHRDWPGTQATLQRHTTSADWTLVRAAVKQIVAPGMIEEALPFPSATPGQYLEL
jgi:hypothetical protein